MNQDKKIVYLSSNRNIFRMRISIVYGTDLAQIYIIFYTFKILTMEGVILKDTASFFNHSYCMFTPFVMHVACTWNTVLNLLRTV